MRRKARRRKEFADRDYRAAALLQNREEDRVRRFWMRSRVSATAISLAIIKVTRANSTENALVSMPKNWRRTDERRSFHILRRLLRVGFLHSF